MEGLTATFQWASQRLRCVCKWCGYTLSTRREFVGGRHIVEVCTRCNCVITPVEPSDIVGGME